MSDRKIIHIEVGDHRRFLDKVFNLEPSASKATVITKDGKSYEGIANNRGAAVEAAVEKMNKDRV